MLFNTATYVLLFLPLVTVLYWHLGRRARMWLILIASLTFYGFWRVDFIPLVLFSAMLDYYLAILIDRTEEPVARRRIMLISVAANLGILGFFKYLNFATQSVGSLAALLGYQPGFTELNIILPLGISFYIFQTLSYTIDVYRREIAPERDWLKYLCFVTFFGHMVAGPILRARTLMPQFDARPPFDDRLVLEGIKRILAGLFLKVVLADTIAGFVDAGFARNPAELGALDTWTLAFLFGFQIYFDFAGYSHIAIGSAKLIGITLPENFNFPYLATSPREFWQRWHISLSTWIRDYLYLPLVGTFRSAKETAWDTVGSSDDQPSQARRAAALFATWTIMGLWHGANWTFAIWGLYHAALIQAHRLIGVGGGRKAGPLVALAGFTVTLPLMMAGWVPFRSRTVDDTFVMWSRLVDPTAYGRSTLGLPPNAYLVAASIMAGMIVVWAWVTVVQPRLARWRWVEAPLGTAYYAVAFALVFVCLQARNQFIYFQF